MTSNKQSDIITGTENFAVRYLVSENAEAWIFLLSFLLKFALFISQS